MKTKKFNVLTVALCFMLCVSTTFVLATSPDHKVTKARAFVKDTIHGIADRSRALMSSIRKMAGSLLCIREKRRQ